MISTRKFTTAIAIVSMGTVLVGVSPHLQHIVSLDELHASQKTVYVHCDGM